ncbi:hypothetical protein [Xylocopilactobacillus apicola]|uniref:Adhesin domain-containing protein n=1 Tax=Xylocopilactobacillus apicola TaxID=2932184 RepID=A0AAU9DH35_9LACO|nr:hypothetical protein [Xylocopilactobacillus apicola]BDR59280.1 hypothetical protein XA3_17210 [Xylocopilactobacillus apicola]
MKMKKYYWINGAIFLIGALMALFGFWNDGVRKFYLGEDFHPVIDRSAAEYNKFHVKTLKEPFNEVRVSLRSTNLAITKGDHFEVKYEINRPVEEFKIEKGVLYVDEKHMEFSNRAKRSPQLTITVPDVNSLNSVAINWSPEGNEISLSDLKLQQLSLHYMPLQDWSSQILLNKVDVSQKMRTDGGNFVIQDSHLTNWEGKSSNGGDTKYLIQNSEITDFQVESNQYFEVSLANSKLLGKNELSGRGSSTMNVEDSQINNCQIKIDEIHLNMKRSQLLGDNRAKGHQLFIDSSQLNEDLSIKVKADTASGTVDGQEIQAGFERERSNNDSIEIKGDEVKLEMK